ncbi:Hypothetical predicted protein [Olea europaea subsp. europaea]|uniref:Uncharacterized protein n=1 Tax=Olea europaea subsp. europaea TaxID=158383 RepID=A0A8S0SK48_OLEEU|nr:Hypothetical predicted protein [Olea europaea subsp. europaea]
MATGQVQGGPHGRPKFNGLGNDENALDGAEHSSNEDPILTDSGNELDSREDDNLYESNVIDEIGVGLNVGELNDVNEHDVEVDAEIDLFDAPLTDVESQPNTKVLANMKLSIDKSILDVNDSNILPTAGNERRTDKPTETLEGMVDML